MSKEARNSQFDFLKPAHGLFNYFTKLVEQYTKILIPSKELLSKLSNDIDNQQKIMDEINYRVEWVKHQLRERAKEEEAVEKERAAYSQIDWHDFVVVETVDYQPQEQGNFPVKNYQKKVRVTNILFVLASNNTRNGWCTNAPSRKIRSNCNYKFFLTNF